jgi:ZIP family zinc transporter/zinc and cadmium transporter
VNVALSLGLGLIAALADVFGGFLLVRRQWEQRYLRYFVALGAGFMMGAAMLEMLPESFALTPKWAPVLVLGGFCIVHVLEHTITPHFHFGEEVHHHEMVSKHTSYSVLGGLASHSLFDGVAIASGFAISTWLGWILFLAVFLHKVPDGFTIASVMMASGSSRRTALFSSCIVAVATILGVLVITVAPRLVSIGLPLSAGVTLYVAAVDLLPETNREPGIRMAIVFLAGITLFLALKLMADRALAW